MSIMKYNRTTPAVPAPYTINPLPNNIEKTLLLISGGRFLAFYYEATHL
jgi:hypothetical protein